MDLNELKSILKVGETVAVEFKRCGNGIENDVYETVCSFLNRFGGDIFLGVEDDGTVLGVDTSDDSVIADAVALEVVLCSRFWIIGDLNR